MAEYYYHTVLELYLDCTERKQIRLYIMKIWFFLCWRSLQSAVRYYTDQSGWLISLRLKEQIRTRNKDSENSAFAEHLVNSRHNIKFEESSGIKRGK